MARQDICRSGLAILATSWLYATSLQAAPPTLSQQLLRSYFDTAGVCTSSQVTDIRDTGTLVTIEVVIEPATRESLSNMNDQDRDNWFSLHCPPEIHGVWRQANPPDDVVVTGQIEEKAPPYSLSCVAFQSNQRGDRDVTLRGRLQRWLEETLDN